MVHRVYVEKKPSEALEAKALANEIRSFLGITSLKNLRIVNRYDVENIDAGLFHRCKTTVFSEPQLDIVTSRLTDIEGCTVFAVEYLPGQFDQRADSAAQCIQIVSQGERPVVRTAKVYIMFGAFTEAEVEAIKRYVINPVECREAGLEVFSTLKASHEPPDKVATLKGFCQLPDEQLEAYIDELGLAMDADDLRCCREYFRSEQRDPTITEIKVLDTYWSDHCRHTTFNTVIDSVHFDDIMLNRAWNEYLRTRAHMGTTKPVTLMDIATIAAKELKRNDMLPRLDVSDEINACTVKISVNTTHGTERWLLLFKNETHNHPTEIEPFGGAATCIGGAIRDPLSGRGYVYSAMRISGAADPTAPISDTLPGKLPQKNRLQRLFEQRLVAKTYMALLEHPMPVGRRGTISLPLAPDLLHRPCQRVDEAHGKAALTHYRVVDNIGGHALVELVPHTGRTHQLRVHCAHHLGLGNPIVGDRLYGTPAVRLMLHAARLAFDSYAFEDDLQGFLMKNGDKFALLG